jgi:hypothetical protein
MVTLQLKCTRTLTCEISTWPFLTSPLPPPPPHTHSHTPASIQRSLVTRLLRWPTGCASRSKTTLSKCCGRPSPKSPAASRQRCFEVTAGQWRYTCAVKSLYAHFSEVCPSTFVLSCGITRASFGVTAGQWRQKFAHVHVLVHLCCKVTTY